MSAGSALAASPAQFGWRLAGVVVGPDVRAALFASAAETRTVTEGEQLDGWTVTAIGRSVVTLERAGEQTNLSLEDLPPEELAEVARARAEEIARAIDAPIAADLQQQQRDQEDGEAALAKATKLMMRH
jgi:hypothetical protein